MSRATVAEARAEEWFDRYIALGPTRSIRRLAAERQQNGSSLNPPPERTLFAWSSKYGLERRAREYDREMRETTRARLLEENENLAVDRQRVALDHSAAFHALVREVLVVREPVMDPEHADQILVRANDDGSLEDVYTERFRRFDEIPPANLYLLTHLHNVATTTEKLYLGNAADRAKEYREEQGGNREVTVLGIEATYEIGTLVGEYVGYLGKKYARKKAQRQLELIDQPAKEVEYNADDPNLIWEEVPEDEE